ncbi:hypothetical protein MIR68_005019 [Amoeboaphelidium protococcarum]|nr:hypothetical protein MIR68_005019 [Amoeboaphelidium protococcarum]
MAMAKSINVSVKSRSGKELTTVGVSAKADVAELKEAIQQKVPKLRVERQLLTFGEKKTRLVEGQTLESYGLTRDGDEVVLKDLGPQVGWKTVFLVEYAGPILIHAFFYMFYAHYYRVKYTPVQKYAWYMVLAHFAKRELETLFVHRFSHGYMPFMNIFKNSFHYWILSGVFIAAEVYSGWYKSAHPQLTSLGQFEYAMIAIFVLAELSNLSTHLTLRNLRPPGTKVRKIPYGYGFDFPFNVSCPNYFFEAVAWVAFTAFTRSYAAAFFTVVATAQMFVWATKKHSNYKKEFKNYPKRKAMFPFLA